MALETTPENQRGRVSDLNKTTADSDGSNTTLVVNGRWSWRGYVMLSTCSQCRFYQCTYLILLIGGFELAFKIQFIFGESSVNYVLDKTMHAPYRGRITSSLN